jgi:hypothetical protein
VLTITNTVKDLVNLMLRESITSEIIHKRITEFYRTNYYYVVHASLTIQTETFEGGDDTILRNVGNHLQDHTAS